MFSALCVCAQKNSYSIKGEIKNCRDTVVSMTIWGLDGTTSDKMSIKNGCFELKGETQNPLMIRIEFSNKEIYKYVPDGGYIPFKCSSVWVIAYPGAKAVVSGELTDFADAYPRGDKENDILTKITSVIFPMMNRYGNIRVQMETDKNFPQTIIEENSLLDAKITEELKKFVAKYPSSFAAVWFLDDMLLRRQITPEEAQPIMADIDGAYRDNEWFRSVSKRVESVKYAVCSKLPEIISTLTPDNTEFSSKSLKGKFIIIDFWGTWCGPCMSGMEHMRQFRDENIDKVEILGIAQDNKASWLNSIESKHLNWIHILNGKGDDDFVAKFNVTGFPTKLLISPDGTILYRESGESETFYNKVGEFLNN